jgi:hypothetical protein
MTDKQDIGEFYHPDDVRRTIACVNFCAGFETVWLENRLLLHTIPDSSLLQTSDIFQKYQQEGADSKPTSNQWFS